MTFELVDAVRRDINLLILLAGASGSGKTESAMRLATGIAGGKKFAVIDTEHGRALHKADDYTFQHMDFDEPFTPERYAEAIKLTYDYPVVIVDSGSHEWEGNGGVLDLQLDEFERMGSKESARLASWKEPKRRHKVYRDALLRHPGHVIVCHRAEDKIDMVKVDGKTKIVPKASLIGVEGWIPICERRLPFEATISLLLTLEAPGKPKPIKMERRHTELIPLDDQLSEDTGKRLAEWAAGGSAGRVEDAATTAAGEEVDPGGDPVDAAGSPADGFAEEEDVTQALELAALVSPETHDSAVERIAKHRVKNGGRVKADWLGKRSAELLAKGVAA